MINVRTHMFIATASSVALSLTSLVAASAATQGAGSADEMARAQSSAEGTAATASSSATPLTARVIDVSGKARWRASPDGEWKDASVNDDLSPGAEVRTGMRSRVTLRFRNATVLVDSSTNFAIPTIEQEGDVLRTIAAVRSGRADFKVDKVGLQNDFKVVTPSSTLAVRGTSFATITGPLKGVEVVGSRDNGIRAIELRYAALNQAVEMSGGSESKSTSETPNPTENALGSTFNAPQSGMVASKEEAQQGALTGSSAPQTQRQATTTVASVTQVKQDIQAAEQGESGNSTISLLIDIARAASLRADAERLVRAMIGTQEDPGPLAQAREAAMQAHQAYGAASRAAAEYDQEVARAQERVAAALEALRDAGKSAASSVTARDDVRTAGADAFGAFLAGGSETAVRDHVEVARTGSAQSAFHAAAVDAALRDADGSLGDASQIRILIEALADQFAAAQAELSGRVSDIDGRALQVEQLRALVDSANAAVQALAAGKAVPQITQSAILAAQAALDALSRAGEAGALRSEAMAKAGEMFLRAQHVLRDAMQAEIAAAAQAAADAGQLRTDADAAAAHAQDSLARIDEAIEGMLQARTGQEEASAARSAAEEFRVLAAARQASASVQAGIAETSAALVSAEYATVLQKLVLANNALEQCAIHGEATSEFAQQVLDRLSQSVPDVAGATESAERAGHEAELAATEASKADDAAVDADRAADRAEEEVLDPAFSASEAEWIRLVDGEEADAEVAEIGSSAADAQAAADSAAEGSGRSELSGVSEWGGSAEQAVLAAAELAEQANQRASEAEEAFIAAEAALAQARSSAERMVWGAVRDLAIAARAEANRALDAATSARTIAGRAIGEANAASEVLSAFGSAGVASSSQQGASAARDAAEAVSAQVLALLQAHQSVLLAHSQSIAQSMQGLGGTLAVTDVAQGSLSQVSTILSQVNGQLLSFRSQSDSASGVTDSQVDTMLGLLLGARNEALAAAFAGSIGAADSSTLIAEHLASLAAGGADAAQARADAIGVILQHTAAAMGVPVSDPSLALIASLAQGASGFATHASSSAQAAAGAAAGADTARDQARTALGLIGPLPQWGSVDIASLFGSDAAAAANAAAQGSADAATASLGASALVAFEGAAQSTRASVDASDSGIDDASRALGIAEDVRAAADQAAASLGSDGAVRLEAMTAIATARGGIESLRSNASSDISAASGGLDGLVSALGSGQATRASALSALASVEAANGSAQIAANEVSSLLSGVLGIRGAFEQALQSIDGSMLSQRQGLQDAQGLILGAQGQEGAAQLSYTALEPNLAQLLAASQAGAATALESDLDQLYDAALWLQQRALAELQRLQQGLADAKAERSLAEAAVAGYETAAAEAEAAVLASAQSAVALATEFLDEVASLRHEHAIGVRVAAALGAREDANAARDAVTQRSLLVEDAVRDVGLAIDRHEAAVSAMSAAVEAAEDARSTAVASLMQLADTLEVSDVALASLWNALLAGDRTAADAQASLIGDASLVAEQSAESADEARATALESLAGFVERGEESSGALASLGTLQGDMSGHLSALGQQQVQLDGALETAGSVEAGLDALVAQAGTDRGEVLADHALTIAGQAIQSASDALESISGLQSSISQAQLSAQAVDGAQVVALQDQADQIRQWAAGLDLPNSSAAQRDAARVDAMAGIGVSAIGAFDARAGALLGVVDAEAARAVAYAERDKVIEQVSVHQSALEGVVLEHQIAGEQRDIAEDELVAATWHRWWAGFWLQQTVVQAAQRDPSSAAWTAGAANESASLSAEARDRANGAATLAEGASGRAQDWVIVAQGAESIVSGAVTLAESSAASAALRASDVVVAAGAAGVFADTAQQLSDIADTVAAEGASAFAREMHSQAVAQIVLAEAARDAAQLAAASARTHADKIVFGAVAAKAAATAALAIEARDFANRAADQATAARTDANTAIAVATSAAGGSTN